MAANQLFSRELVTFVAATFFALLCSSPQGDHLLTLIV
jgi:choline dehydrogenase